MSSASDTFARKRAEVIQAGKATDEFAAGVWIYKHAPEVYRAYMRDPNSHITLPISTEDLLAPPAPLDYAQRQALSKQTDFPLTVPPARSGYQDFLDMVDAMLRQHPGMSESGAKQAVMQQQGGKQAYERHRQEMIFGRR